MKRYEIGKNESGQRMDRFVSRVLPRASWGEIQKLFRKKIFKRNGSRAVKANDFLQLGDIVEFFLSDESMRNLGATASSDERFIKENSRSDESEHVRKPCKKATNFMEKGALKGDEKVLSSSGIVRIYEDDDFLAVSKPTGMLVHSGERESKDDLTTIVRRYLADCIDVFFSPSTASRLDRGTSGVVVFAKNYQSLKKMNEEMRAHRIDRIYHCIVEGNLTGSGAIELSLCKDRKKNKVYEEGGCGYDERIANKRADKMSDEWRISEKQGALDEGRISKKSGSAKKRNVKYAKTQYHSEALPGGAFSLVTAILETGRTHQIRVSLSNIGHPIVGDIKYGSKIKRNSPLLHCAEVGMMGMRFECKSEEIIHFVRHLIDRQKNV